MTALAGLCRRVRLSRARGALAIVIGALLPGCEWMPGKPTAADAWQSPHSVVDFEQLYMENCRGCHGTKNEPAGAITLDNPTYIAVVPRETLRSIITNGVPGTAMIAFSEEHGGPLTEKQIEILVEGITAWGAKNPPPGPLPAYSGPLGDVGAGRDRFRNVLRELPWRRRDRWRQGRLGRPSRLRRSGQRPIPADHRNRRAQRPRLP